MLHLQILYSKEQKLNSVIYQIKLCQKYYFQSSNKTFKTGYWRDVLQFVQLEFKLNTWMSLKASSHKSNSIQKLLTSTIVHMWNLDGHIKCKSLVGTSHNVYHSIILSNFTNVMDDGLRMKFKWMLMKLLLTLNFIECGKELLELKSF